MIQVEGACSNQVVKCIIYTNDLEIGRQKLNEIEIDKGSRGICAIRKNRSQYHNETVFDDGEEWIIVKPNSGARGYRWRKAWIDVKTSHEQLVTRVLPYGDMYKWQNEMYFNWN